MRGSCRLCCPWVDGVRSAWYSVGKVREDPTKSVKPPSRSRTIFPDFAQRAARFLVGQTGRDMAGEWIKMLCTLPNNPKVDRIAEILGIEPLHAMGCVLAVWAWAGHTTTNGVVKHGTRATIDRHGRKTGLADAMISVGWLEANDSGVLFPKWKQHNDKCAKTRALAAVRQSRLRNAPTVTKPSRAAQPEVSRGEKVMVRGENTSKQHRGEGDSGAQEGHHPETPRIRLAGEHTTHQHPEGTADRAICKRLLDDLRWNKQERGTIKTDRISRKQLGRLLELPGCVPVRVHMLCERVKRGDGKDNPATWIEAGIDRAWECNGQDEKLYREWYTSVYGVEERMSAIRARARA